MNGLFCRPRWPVTTLRRANPPRGVDVPPPSCTLEVLRRRVSKTPFRLAQAQPKRVEAVKVALEGGRPPDDVDVAATAVAMFLASSRVGDEPEVDDVNETLLSWFGDPELPLRALARRAPLVQSKPCSRCPASRQTYLRRFAC